LIQKRFIITGMIQVGDFMRLILYPDEPVKKKRVYDMISIASSGNVSEMQKDAIIDSIICGNPPTMYVTLDELKESELSIGHHVILTLGREYA
jgi:hypothetical protein